MKSTLALILTVAALASGARASNPSLSNQEPKDGSKAVAGQPKTPEPLADDAYKIGPQDVLKIDVWKEDQLTRTVPVRPDGKITLPLLNDVQAAGLTPMELASAITEQLKKYINSPQVTVSLSEINSRRVYVTGEVLKGGAFALLPHMTVLQALSSSGGFTQFARTKSIYVLRTDNGKQTKKPFNYKEAISGKNPEQNIELLPGDVIVVP